MKNQKIEIIKDAVILVLKNIYDLGLIYEIDVDENFEVKILMTLTSANCPVSESMPSEVQQNIQNIKGVNNVKVELTFEPPWDQENISDEAKLELGLL